MRTQARETLFKIVFASQFEGEDDEQLRRAMYKGEKLGEDDIAYCERALKIIREKSDFFAQVIDKHSYAFPEKRIFPADRSILLVALAEIYEMDDVPEKVSANEAANIASKYSSEKSASYISGLISSIIEEKKNV